MAFSYLRWERIHTNTEFCIWLFNLENCLFIHGGIPITPKPRHLVNFALINHFFIIKYGIVDMHPQNLTDYEVACPSLIAKGFYFDYPTLHFHFAFLNHRGFYQCGSLFGEAGFYKLVYLLWEFATGETGLLNHIIINYIDSHFRQLQDILQGMFGGIISSSP